MSEQAVLIPNALPPSPYETALLPWEDAEAFTQLREEYFAVYPPGGPTERHILEQIVWCDWRRRRLVLGERALHMASLESRTSEERRDGLSRRALAVSGGTRPEVSSAGAIKNDDDEDAETEKLWAGMVEQAEAAERLLEANAKDCYAQALACLPEETAEWFLETCETETEEKYNQDRESLQRFLSIEVLPFFRKHLAGAQAGPTVRPKLGQSGKYSIDLLTLDRALWSCASSTRKVSEPAQGSLSLNPSSTVY